MRDRRIIGRHLLAASVLACSLAACGTAGDDEVAFCEALRRNDAAAAKALFDTGQIDMKAAAKLDDLKSLR